MDKNSLLRFALIALVSLAIYKWGMPLLSGSSDPRQPLDAEVYADAPAFSKDPVDAAFDPKVDGNPASKVETCSVDGQRFTAEFSTRGAGLAHFFLHDPQYASSDSSDLSTTPDIERWHSLRTLFRGKDAGDQVRYDRFLWSQERVSPSVCRFTYEDVDARIVKTFSAGERPFELNLETKITNLADGDRRHQLSVATFAFRANKEIKGNIGRVSPFVTDVSCAAGSTVERKNKDDFKKSGWFTVPGTDRYAAIANYYFGQALIPTDTNVRPDCSVLVEDWYKQGQKRDDDDAGAVYHAKLVYPARKLAPNETASYTQTAFFGPKDREILKNAAGGTRGLGDLINLGFLSPVAKVLVSALHKIFHVTKNWGVAIIVLTLGVRILLFPLTWKVLKSTVAMRKLKPEIDELNVKFAGDMQAKNMATMELYRKHGVNPLGGCLPQLVQMPVWFAMYTTLQTAVEMYHTKFLWFSDLSAPDRFYLLPLILGGFMIVQQRIVPQQGMDPVQQKMMMYIMPAIFTAMMLFLPAALGVYMLTNSILGITQQLAVEKLAPRNGGDPASIVRST